MLNLLFENLITKLKDMSVETNDTPLFKQVEPYEGQFDNISEYLLLPPSAFVELSDGGPNQEGRQNTLTSSVAIYVTTDHIKGNKPTAMFNIIDQLRKQLNKQCLGNGFLKFDGYQRLAIFPGFITYQVNFQHEEM